MNAERGITVFEYDEANMMHGSSIEMWRWGFRFNSLAQGDVVMISIMMIRSGHMLRIKFMGTSCEIVLRWMPQSTFEKCLMIKVQFGSGKSLVPSGNKQ